MPSIMLVKGRMKLSPDVPRLEELESYKNLEGVYSFPVCPDIVRRIYESVPGIIIDDDLMNKLRELKVWTDRSAEISEMQDAPGDERLLSYQRVAVEWLLHVKRGILADEQGLGKTVMTLRAAEEVRPSKALIICSKTKCRDWHEHVLEWTSSDSVILEGDAEDRDAIISEWTGFIVCNYAQASIHKAQLSGCDLVIVDECHKLRNRKTKSFKDIRSISRRSSYLFLATASPNVNCQHDMWTLLNMCDPVRFSSYWGFVFRFFHVEDDGFGLKVGELREDEEDRFIRMVSSYVLRREGLLDLPIPEMRRVDHEMTGRQRSLYDDLDKRGVTFFGVDEYIECLTDLSLITRLRQVSQDPGVLWPDYSGPSKTDTLISIVKESDSKVVVFTSFSEVVDRAVKRMNSKGVAAVGLTGSLRDRDREEVIDEFRQGDAQVIVVTHGVGGEGLNLVEADRVVFLELAWHPAGNKHALHRVLRIGQKSDRVQVNVIHAVDSIDDHIEKIINRKGRVSIEDIMKMRGRGNA